MLPWQDIRFGARMLIKDRWFTLAAVTALALGIGLNTMVFTLVNAILLRSLPVRDPERIVSITTRDARDRQLPMSLQDFEDIRAQSHSFDGLTLVRTTAFNLSEDAIAAEQVTGSYISANVFQVVGAQPILGRNFRPEDDQLGAPPVVLLANGVWKRRYGGDPSVMGRNIKLNGLVATVIGVMPEGMQFPNNNDLWLPSSQLPPGARAQKRDVRNFQLVGRLADGVSLEQAGAELSSIGENLAQEYPTTNKDMRPRVVSYQEQATGGGIRTLFISLMGAVAFVLLIACTNVANLLLARAAHRAKEISVRVSLGASRWRIVRQLLVESVMLALLSGGLGLVIAIAGIRWFDAALPPGKPYWMTFTLDPIVFAFIAAISLGTGILFGLAPALHVSKANINEVLKEGGRSGGGGIRARRWTTALLVGELALTLVLLAGAGYMMSSFLAIYRIDRGVDTSRLLTMNLLMPDRKYPSPAARASFLERVNERLSANSALESATTTTAVPSSGGETRRLELNGKVSAPGETLPIVTMLTVGPQYFKTIGVPTARGRVFNQADGPPGHEAVIVNQRFGAMHFPNEDPVGKVIRLNEEIASAPKTGWMTIVGVVPNVRQRIFQQPGQPADPLPDPVVYLPVQGNPNYQYSATLLVRMRNDPAQATKLVREEMRLLDPDLALFAIRTVDELLALQRWPQRVFGTLFGFFAAIALILSSVGLYAVTAYSVTQRTQEIGVRVALGARARQVLWLILRRAVVQLGIGLVIGLAGAIAVGRLLRSIPFVQVGTTDSTSLVAVSLLFVVVALLASVLPAQRAARVNPVIALRAE